MSQPATIRALATAPLRRLALSVLFTITTNSYQTTCTVSKRTFNKRQHANATRRVDSSLTRITTVMFMVMFSQTSMILFTGGSVSQHALGQTSPMYPSMHWGRHPPVSQHALGQTPPPAETPCVSQHALGQTPPWADTPGRHPFLPDTPLADTSPADGYCSGRYASYRNAFFFTDICT